MATVYLAQDERLGRKVAIKRLHSDSPEDAARRFEREAKVGASLSHPNLVTVFDTVADDDGVLIVMEYVQGENLAELMARKRVPSEQAVSIIRQVAGALDHAHKAGVVHRDVKPANILISPDGKAKLVDLGIATASERTQITQVGTVLGTPSYMAPEQLEGGNVTKAVDIYALGAVAYELLSGRKARDGRTPMEIAHRIATGPVPDIRDAWADAPAPAATALRAAMARDPRDRPQSAGQLARELDDAFKATQLARTRPLAPETTRAMPVVPIPAAPPADRPAARPGAPGAERASASPRPRTAQPPRRPAQPAPPRQSRGGLPRWIPVALVALVVAAGAIAALSSGGHDKATPPAEPTTHSTTAHKKKKSSPAPAPTPAPAPAQTQTQTQTQQQPATTTPSQTAPSTSSQPKPAPSNDPAQMQLQAHNLINQGKYDQAIALDRQIVAKGPGIGLTYAYALFDLGHALRVTGHPDQAIPILEQRLKINNQRDVVKQELEKAKAEAKSG